MGLPLDAPALMLSTLRLAGVVANERADLTIAVRAGTTLQGVNVLLAGQGQFVPFDAPQPRTRPSAVRSPRAGWVRAAIATAACATM